MLRKNMMMRYVALATLLGIPRPAFAQKDYNCKKTDVTGNIIWISHFVDGPAGLRQAENYANADIRPISSVPAPGQTIQSLGLITLKYILKGNIPSISITTFNNFDKSPNKVKLRILDGSNIVGTIGASFFDFTGPDFTTIRKIANPSVQIFMNDAMLGTFFFNSSSFGLAEKTWPKLQAQIASDISRAGGRLPAYCGESPGVACFFTTVAVETVGLTDDCWELTHLRRMRDRMRQGPGRHRALVEQYEEVAPKIVRQISSRKDARSQWLRAYWFGIVPTALLCAAGLENAAITVYSRLYRRLVALSAEINMV